jgi:hypothetical protein
MYYAVRWALALPPEHFVPLAEQRSRKVSTSSIFLSFIWRCLESCFSLLVVAVQGSCFIFFRQAWLGVVFRFQVVLYVTGWLRAIPQVLLAIICLNVCLNALFNWSSFNGKNHYNQR